MSRKVSDVLKVQIILILVAGVFGINPTIVKVGAQELQPMVFNTLRLFVASVSFICLTAATKSFKKIEFSDIGWFVVIGISTFLFQLGFVCGMQYIASAVGATILGIMPISVLLIHHLVMRTPIGSNSLIGALISLFGVILVTGLISGGNTGADRNAWIGMSLLFMCQLCGAVYSTVSEKLVKRYSHYQVTGSMFLFAFLVFLPLAWRQIVILDIAVVSDRAWFCIIYGGVVSLCIANALWIWGIKTIGSQRAVIFNNLQPVFALMSGMFVLQEIPSFLQVIGVVIVVLGLYVFSSKKKVGSSDKYCEMKNY